MVLAGNARGDAALVFEGDRRIAVATARPGRPFGKPRDLPGAEDGHNPQVVVDEHGNLLVEWIYDDGSQPADPFNSHELGCCQRIALALRRAGTKAFSAPKTVGRPGEYSYPQAFSMINGRIGVSWFDANGLAARFSRRGLKLGPVVRPPGPGALYGLSAMPLRTGPALTFESYGTRPDGSDSWSISEFRVRPRRPPATRTLVPQRSGFHLVGIATNAHGGQALAWAQEITLDSYDIFAATWRRGGNFRLRRVAHDMPYQNPRVTLASAGEALLVWRDGPGQVLTSSGRAGAAFGPGLAFTRRGVSDIGAPAIDSAGRSVIAWTRSSQTEADHELAAFRSRTGRRMGLHAFGAIGPPALQPVLDETGIARIAWREGPHVFAALSRFPGSR